jgi:hypothetical protein
MTTRTAPTPHISDAAADAFSPRWQHLRKLLLSGNLEASDAARADLESARVDPRLVAVLAVLVERHRIRVSMIKTGHPMGPRSQAGHDNDHYFYRAADIDEVDGEPVATHPAAPGVAAIGRLLMALRGETRPARMMGPTGWHEALGSGDRTGFRSDEFTDEIHRDHLHIGF